MIVCYSKLYMTRYVLSKLTYILPDFKTLSLHDLNHVPNHVYAFNSIMNE